MSPQLKKLARYLVVLSVLILTFIMVLPVQAGSADFSGTVNSSDSFESWCYDYNDVYAFNVSTTGIYTVSVNSANFNGMNYNYGAVFGLLSSSSSLDNFLGYAYYENYYGAIYTGGYLQSQTLTAGQTYYLFVSGCGYIYSGYYTSVDYTVTISGVGNVNGGTSAPTDSDSDGVADSSDNCPNDANSGQEDNDNDGTGNACDSTPNGPDDDSDGVPNTSDNCVTTANSGQEDTDTDGTGDACDSTPNGDSDSDGVDDGSDNCLGIANPGQADGDSDGAGDACDSTPTGDNDSDGVDNATDNCVDDANPGQENADGDSAGDACDSTPNGDDDSDGVDNLSDNCPTVANAGQNDGDADGVGDACDGTPTGDTDADGIDNAVDNCPTVVNAGQADSDRDGTGDMCDSTPHTDSDADGVADIADDCPTRGDEGFGVKEDGCPPFIVLPPDHRINWQYGDLNAVVYKHADGAVVYCHNGNTWLGMHVNQASVDGWDASQPQDVPVLSVDHAGCRTAFYILDSGEYQINIWTFEGKLYEMIADNLHFDNATMRYFDPNE